MRSDSVLDEKVPTWANPFKTTMDTKLHSLKRDPGKLSHVLLCPRWIWFGYLNMSSPGAHLRTQYSTKLHLYLHTWYNTVLPGGVGVSAVPSSSSGRNMTLS